MGVVDPRPGLGVYGNGLSPAAPTCGKR
jgi:hypothetical protein